MKTAQEVAAKLSYFVIFQPSEIPNKGESLEDVSKQIHYYHPISHSLELQVKAVGLAQSLASFTSLFNYGGEKVPSPGSRVGRIETKSIVWKTGKCKSILALVEGDYWILLSIRFGAKILIEKESSKKYASYFDWQISDEFMKFLVDRCYARFTLINHSFFRLRVEYKTTAAFQSKLETHFGIFMKIIDSWCLCPSALTLESGMQKAPFNDEINRKVILTASRLSTSLPDMVGSCMILWKNGLAWSSLSSHLDTYLLYQYLTDPDTGKLDDGLINQVKAKGEPVISQRLSSKKPQSNSFFGQSTSKRVNFSGFLVGLTTSSGVQSKTIFLSGRPFSFILYQSEESHFTICMLFPNMDRGSALIKVGYEKLVVDLMKPLCDTLAVNQKLLATRRETSKNVTYYMTFDYTNFTIKSSLLFQIGPEVLASLAHLRDILRWLLIFSDDIIF